MSLSKAKQIEEAIKAESEKPRIGKVVFYGLCCVCGEKIDVSNKLEYSHKKYMIDSFGIEKIDEKWVCKQEIPLPNCPFCEKPPF